MFGLGNYLYLVVTQGKLKATELKSGRTVEKSLEPAAHPRTPVGNFEELERIFTEAISELGGRSLFRPAPVAFLHLLDEVEGGYTPIEIRVFKEAILGGGARNIFIPESRTLLTKDELLNKRFVEMSCA
jgi:hypothetical protein